jgi:hypothetical protein
MECEEGEGGLAIRVNAYKHQGEVRIILNWLDLFDVTLYNPDGSFYITLNRDILVLFYEEYTKFNYKFTYELSTTWIDSYTINASSYTDLILEDKFKVEAHKIRGKTIHKRPNS